MKPKNFPQKKLERQLRAKMRLEGRYIATQQEVESLLAARQVRTKKDRR